MVPPFIALLGIKKSLSVGQLGLQGYSTIFIGGHGRLYVVELIA